MVIHTLDGTEIGVEPQATPGPVIYAKAIGLKTTDGTPLEASEATVPVKNYASCDVSVIARSSSYSRTFRVSVSARRVGVTLEITGIDVLRPPQGDDEAVAWMVDFSATEAGVVPVVIGESGVNITWDVEVVARTSSS